MQPNGKLASPASSPTSDEKILRVLCAEDNPRDVRLTTEILKRAGYQLALDHVEDPVLFRARLEQVNYDIVICDYNLLDWTALDALEIVQESGKDVPVIVLSGCLGDEAAVECIKLGATDYVLKDRSARLPLAIKRALEAKSARAEHRAAELASRESAEEYRLLFEGNPNPMWVFDAEALTILAVNDTAVRHYGYSREEFLGMAMSNLPSPDEVPRLLARLATLGDGNSTMGTAGMFKHRKKSGELMEIEVASSPLLFQGRRARLVLANDVTERNSLQAQLLQAQKMESLGRLAGGVAHDLNNLMGVVLGYGELTLDRLEAASPLRANVEGMQKAADKAVVIVRQLLAFSRKQIQWPRMLSLNAVVKDSEELLQRLIGEDIKLFVATEPHLGTVKADPGLIEQVIMNLAVNARDAMADGGQLTISTANVDLDGPGPRHELDCPIGPHVILEVSDTGCGIDADTQARMFEPFFTTKGPGKGTGLGLSMVYGIVKQSGGSISVHSEPGHGSTFRICLPRVEAAPQPLREVKLSAEMRGGSETVLLVEDAEAFREVVSRFLREGGYDVRVAKDGIAALVAAHKHHGPIHLLLTDVVMPVLSGPLLAQNLSLDYPDMKVLYMSGYTDEALGTHGMLEEGTALLEKPFTREALLRKIREVLDRVTSVSSVASDCEIGRCT
jgi:PAS domain S-box-containing protein